MIRIKQSETNPTRISVTVDQRVGEKDVVLTGNYTVETAISMRSNLDKAIRLAMLEAYDQGELDLDVLTIVKLLGD